MTKTFCKLHKFLHIRQNSKWERVCPQHANPNNPPLMRRPTLTATTDVEFGITGAKSHQTNHGSAHGLWDVLQSLSYPRLSSVHIFSLNCPCCLRLMNTFSGISRKKEHTNKPVTDLKGGYNKIGFSYIVVSKFPTVEKQCYNNKRIKLINFFMYVLKIHTYAYIPTCTQI